MALRVWLPLNGNLNNQGLSNIQINNTGAIINNAGKIGKAYEFGASHWLRLEKYAAEFLTYKEFSLSVWFKCTAHNTSHGGSALISAGNWNQPSNLLNLGLSEWSTDHYTRLIISGSGTWSAGYDYDFNLNTWYHVALTSGNGKMRAYVNGELIGDSYNAFTPTSLEQDWICIGNGTYYSGFIFNGLMNDVRIYDECLSPKQIKEISKGLVAHYKLDNQFRSNRNITLGYYGTATNAGWGAHRGTATYTEEENNNGLPFKKVTKFVVTYDTSLGSGGGTSVYPSSRYDVLGDTQYTYSIYVKAEDNFSYLNANFLYRYEYNAAGTTLIEGGICSRDRMQYIGNGWYRVWGTFTTKTDTVKIALPFYTYCGKNNVYYLGGQQLELGGMMTPYIDNTYNLLENESDCSGNGYTATPIGTCSYSLDTSRYSGSTLFTSSNIGANTFTGASFLTGEVGLTTPNALTVSFWGKVISYNYQNSGILGLTNNTYPSALTEDTINQYDGNFRINASSGDYCSLSALNLIVLNEWHLYTITFDGTTTKSYRDGTLIETKSLTGPLKTFSRAILGLSQAGGSYRKTTAYWNDFRIYTTALSIDDIKQLYQTSAMIDNQGNAYAYEFREE